MWQPEKQENGIWWARRDSNPQPSRYERPALPLSYRPPPVEGSPIADRPLALQALMPKCAAERLPENHPVMQASRRASSYDQALHHTTRTKRANLRRRAHRSEEHTTEPQPLT